MERNWDRKPTSVLEAWLCQLQGRTIEKGSSSNKMATYSFRWTVSQMEKMV